MDNKKFTLWCNAATGWIRFGPDRKRVSKELLDHLEDHRDALMAQGLTEQEATDKALECMGSASDISVRLAAVHRPFWGYLLRYSRIAAIILLCLCLLTVGNYVKSINLEETPDLRKYDIYSIDSYGGETGRTLLHLSQPDLSFSTDGHRFTVTDACVMSQGSDYYGPDFTQLYIRMKQTSFLPCLTQNRYFVSSWMTAGSGFIARDSLGNEYSGFFTPASNSTQWINPFSVQSGLFTFTHELWINNFPADAEWVDICYERDGRSFSLRIYLDGGVAS